jgi:hypothetical protein
MRNITVIALGWMLWQNAASAQTNNVVTTPAENPVPNDGPSGVVGATGDALPPEYKPLTASERWRLYFMSAFGPAAIARAAASGGIAQWTNTPKEWRGGAKAYGERFGNAYAEHIIRKTLEAPAAAILHEDNRYFRSTETGFWRRSKHAVGSIFVARNEAGREHFAYSRFGGALGSAFISRIWQPPSKNTSGDAAEYFGITMAADIGWNVFREFRPRRFRRR